ncbi:hypothetical protein Tsp_10567 [Trichinella spiralis]|uniref:hypothetical protein n=1 Tax=Trichinella spiralis TaxID=6334 RepID=UPI0001EFD78A|nr:hypothetical protein Tsp_10567 [Trichinella spiralis]
MENMNSIEFNEMIVFFMIPNVPKVYYRLSAIDNEKGEKGNKSLLSKNAKTAKVIALREEKSKTNQTLKKQAIDQAK